MKMPTIFVGHGSPMNAIENNKWTKKWKEIGKKFTPSGIIILSAHWYTDGLFTQNNEQPRKINDMYGFPKALYDTSYSAKGSKKMCDDLKKLLKADISIDNTWGIDHGAWSVLIHMYPKANIPIIQISIDKTKTPQEHFELGKKLTTLRENGYMILGSGSVVHNLYYADFSSNDAHLWAKEFDKKISNAIQNNNFLDVINYTTYGKIAKLSVPTQEHYLPLLTVLGASCKNDTLEIFNQDYTLGGISMTGYLYS